MIPMSVALRLRKNANGLSQDRTNQSEFTAKAKN